MSLVYQEMFPMFSSFLFMVIVNIFSRETLVDTIFYLFTNYYKLFNMNIAAIKSSQVLLLGAYRAAGVALEMRA